MDIDEAVQLIDGLIFRPGWMISSEPLSDGDLVVFFDIDTVDTSTPLSDGRYTTPKHVLSTKFITSGDLASFEPDHLRYRILELAHEVDWHEDCEFLREWDGTQWVAAFHPHNTETNARRASAAWEIGRKS